MSQKIIVFDASREATTKDLYDVKPPIREASARIRSSVRGAVETDGGAGISDS